jgi:hypothetical protein
MTPRLPIVSNVLSEVDSANDLPKGLSLAFCDVEFELSGLTSISGAGERSSTPWRPWLTGATGQMSD